MTKNLYKTTYEDGEIEYCETTPSEKQSSDKRLKDLKIDFTTEKVNHLKKNIN